MPQAFTVRSRSYAYDNEIEQRRGKHLQPTLHSTTSTTIMFSARVTRAAAQHFQSIRTQAQRRFASNESQFTNTKNNSFNRERQAVKDHAAATSDLWRKLSIYEADYCDSATIPCLIIATVNTKILWDAHWDHWDHMEPLEERTEYAYQNMRTRNYFWGDGDKTIFWNDKVNYHKKG
ncbi:cytochrome c oxidase subunit VIa [Sclerotinia borealis F-4128]|uniref:Cytochrome c oxidase subunit VIa n=1 Tax=Sclerotinia borealis (strain F-4128) TaxID=1432307 RepID=W9C4B1_SCLBF|nr:cytochrome c oxidase subunit VIa [Sclerotinia borealis F-4128]